MNNLKSKIIHTILIALRIFPIKKNKIVFSAYYGKAYACNPKYITEELLKRDLKLDIVWILPDEIECPKSIRKIKEKSIKGLYELATAKIWVDNCRKSNWLIKRKEQFYIQTWHGGISNKLAEGYAIDKLPKAYIESAIHDSEMCDLFLSNSSLMSKIYQEAFWYNGNILEKGFPREDILVHDNSCHEKICKFYNIDENTKLFVYAPTFRDNGDVSAYNIDFKKLFDSLTSKGEKWKIIVRLHPNVQNLQSSIKYDDNILNGSLISDINDLILSCDYFVTDYSSCMFDAIIANRKVLIYASDIDKYKCERGFMFEWDELPFPMATYTNELIDLILHFNEKDYYLKVEDFKKKVGLFQVGNASSSVADYIVSIIGKELIY